MAEVRRLSPFELWQQAGGDPQDYRRLMREHGHLVPGTPQPLPCGWPGGSGDDDAEHCAWCAASGEMQSFNGQYFCDEDCADAYMTEWENPGQAEPAGEPEDAESLERIAERFLKGFDEVLTGTGAHADHARRQIGRCVYCSCGVRVQGRMTGAARD